MGYNNIDVFDDLLFDVDLFKVLICMFVFMLRNLYYGIICKNKKIINSLWVINKF